MDEPRFRLAVEDGQVRFEFKAHYATEEQAREEIADYIRVWEFDATLRRGNPDSLRLQFEKADIIGRDPTPGAAGLKAHFVAAGTGSAKLTVSAPNYPAPPSDVAINCNVEIMHLRYMRYRENREPLPSMAYFCLTVLEAAAGSRKAAAGKYGIDMSVLNRIGDLTANRGGAEARKAGGVVTELSPQERHFLDRAVKAIVRRAAERAHAPTDALLKISLSELPSPENVIDQGADATK